MAIEKRVLHCWKDGPSIMDWMEAHPDRDVDECMLEKNHAGPHEFTPDDQIGISFAPAEKDL